MELEETEEIQEKNPELQEVKIRLDKLEETIKEIAVESRKPSGSGTTKNSEKDREGGKVKHGENNMGNASESSKSVEDHLGRQKIELAPVLPKGRESESTSQENGQHPNDGGGSSPDAKR